MSGPVTDWRPVRGVTRLCSSVAVLAPATPNIQPWMDEKHSSSQRQQHASAKGKAKWCKAAGFTDRKLTSVHNRLVLVPTEQRLCLH